MICVLSPGRCGSTAVARRIRAGLPDEGVVQLHGFGFYRGHLLPRMDRPCPAPRDEDDPDWDAAQRGFARRIRDDGECGDDRFLLVLREPIAREVSAWRAFHEGRGDFERDYDHDALARWFDDQVLRYLDIRLVMGWFESTGELRDGAFSGVEFALGKIAVVRLEDVERDLGPAVKWLTGKDLGVAPWDNPNPSVCRAVPNVSPELADRLQGAGWARAFYSPERLAAARRLWVGEESRR